MAASTDKTSATADALREEDLRMRRLRVMVDLTAALICHRPLSEAEANYAVENLRRRVLEMFPEKGDAFDLIYRPRFARLIGERFGSRRERFA